LSFRHTHYCDKGFGFDLFFLSKYKLYYHKNLIFVPWLCKISQSLMGLDEKNQLSNMFQLVEKDSYKGLLMFSQKGLIAAVLL